MAPQIQIEFLDTLPGSESIYRVPNNIRGVAKLTVRDKPVDAQAVAVTFFGISKFKFHKRPSSNRTEIYRAEFVLTNQTIVIQTGSTANNPLRPGDYAFPFVFRTTDETGRFLHSSIADTHGEIRYQLEAKLYGAKSARAATDTKLVTLVNPPFISRLPLAERERQYGEDDMTMGCCCWRPYSVKLSAEIPKGAYRPGETIEVKLHVVSHSPKMMTPKVSLVKTRRIMINEAEHKDNMKIYSHKLKDAILPMAQGWSTIMTIFIPPNMHPGTVRDVGYVDVNYTVKAAVSIPWEIFDAEVKLPIVIGQ